MFLNSFNVLLNNIYIVPVDKKQQIRNSIYLLLNRKQLYILAVMGDYKKQNSSEAIVFLKSIKDLGFRLLSWSG